MRVLYQFPLSHFCEKARWLLDHKELDYVAQNLVPGLHRAFAQLKTGQNKLPILKDGERYIADSTEIALYLDQTYPEHALLRADPKLREQGLAMNQLANELGSHVRRWTLAHSLSESDEPLEIILGEKGYLRQLEKFSKPLLKSWISKSYRLDEPSVDQSKQRMDELIQQLNQILIANHGRYLVGDRFGLADIAVCAMLAPILELAGTPWEKEQGESCSLPAQAFKEHLLSLPLGQYVQRIYQTERNARVDWRGV